MQLHVRFVTAIFVCAVSLVAVNTVRAEEVTYASALFSADTLVSQPVSIELNDATIYVPAQTLDTETRIKIRDRGAVQDADTGSLPAQYRSKAHVYSYFFEGDFSADAATLILEYTPGNSEHHKKTIFFQPINDVSQEWTRLETRADPETNTIRALLPEAEGRVVFARHRSKKERPIESLTFAAYSGTPYSDTAAVIDMKSGKFLYTQEASKQRSIASISKLATTLVFLESQPDLSDVITYSSDSDREGATVDLASGDQLTLEQVLMSTLIPSANNMAVTLSVNAGMDSAAFVSQMNAKVQAIGLKKTSFAEPTGLNPENVSTAGNIAKLARYAFKEFGDVYESAEASSSYTFSLTNSDRTITVYSTNKFNGRGLYEAVAFKTGYLPGTADRTLVMEIREIATGHEIVVSLLGNPQYNTIFDEAYSLAYWTFHNWDFQNYD